MHALTIKPYTNVQKISLNDFWDMVEAHENRHDKYTYTMRSTTTDFDVVYSTGYGYGKCTVSLSDFCGYYLDSQIRVDGVAIVLQHCEDYDTLFVIEA